MSKGIGINKTTASKNCDICHHWNFLHKNFKYEPYLCNDCHDLMQKALMFLLKEVIIEFIYDAINIKKSFNLN